MRIEDKVATALGPIWITPTELTHVHARRVQFNVRGQLFRASSPTGWYVVIYYIPDQGQTGNTWINYLDDLNSELRDNHSEHTLDLRIVLERLTIARNKAQETAVSR